MKKLSPPERINKIIEHLNLSIDAFGKKVNKGRAQSIYDIMDGKTKSITPKMAQKILDLFPEFNEVWLLTGTGEMLKKDKNEETEEIGYSKEYQLRNSKDELVPCYESDVTSSVVTSFNDVPEIPSFYVDYKPFNDCTAYFPNLGDSMYPKYKNGEKLAVKQIFNFDVIMWGETYLVITNSEENDLKTVKDVFPHEDEDKLILRASNPSYKGDTPIRKKNIISMFAVKGKISQNFM